MSTGRFTFRGFAQQGWRAATYALANSGAAPTPVAIDTRRHYLSGSSGERYRLTATTGERAELSGAGSDYTTLTGCTR
jgi:hypothetical protein